MPAQISILRNALKYPMDHFKTLWRIIRAVDDDNITIDDNYTFAEAEVYTRDNNRALLFMPLKPIELNRCPQLISPPSSMLCPYRVYPQEIVTDSEAFDIILQLIHEGDPLSLSPIDSQTALKMVDILEQECKQIGFSHNRLSANNVIVGYNNRLYPIRYHYATMDGCKDDFNILRAAILENQKDQQLLNDIQSSYTNRYCDIFDSHNGYIRFCDEGLYGYKNHKGEDIIPAQYLWASDFCEHRAIVETPEGFGVINPQNKMIIRPYLESLYYDTSNSLFYYYDNDEICAFDYNGTPLRPNDPRLKCIK